MLLESVIKLIGALRTQGKTPVAEMCRTCRYFWPKAHSKDPERPHLCAFVDAPFRIPTPSRSTAPTTSRPPSDGGVVGQVGLGKLPFVGELPHLEDDRRVGLLNSGDGRHLMADEVE